MFKTLIFLDKNSLDKCLNLTEVAQKLRQETEESEICGLGFDLGSPQVTGIDKLIDIDGAAVNLYDAGQVSAVLAEVQQQFRFDCILILANSLGKMLAPRLAMKLKTGLTAEITDAALVKGERHLIRPAFQGNRMASIVCHTSPIMASVRPDVFRKNDSDKVPEKLSIQTSYKEKSALKVIAKSKSVSHADITKSKVLVSGGGGIEKDFALLSVLSETLNGELAASKKLVDAGGALRDIQVGQSGKIVSPNLYMAFGIHGTVHHVAGLREVKHIISVNTNKLAPISALSTIVVEGDAADFAQKLNKKIKENAQGVKGN
ncbi:electron transfer flavoprotein subunit alpha/FixB family protein [Lactococcus muris]|uniref:Electron transfer flavoprotein subunit alpha/FixB family protein n=1 Tax=Lactococcus muris TaxID=2941330 RepID=A0ABV4DBD4_9LACT